VPGLYLLGFRVGIGSPAVNSVSISAPTLLDSVTHVVLAVALVLWAMDSSAAPGLFLV
jgi:hypothetical protein